MGFEMFQQAVLFPKFLNYLSYLICACEYVILSLFYHS